MPSAVEVTVVSQKGKCAFGHKVGDKIVFDGRSVKGDVCYGALLGILPRVYALRFGAEFPFAKMSSGDSEALCSACVDADNPVVFKIHRIKK